MATYLTIFSLLFIKAVIGQTLFLPQTFLSPQIQTEISVIGPLSQSFTTLAHSDSTVQWSATIDTTSIHVVENVSASGNLANLVFDCNYNTATTTSDASNPTLTGVPGHCIIVDNIQGAGNIIFTTTFDVLLVPVTLPAGAASQPTASTPSSTSTTSAGPTTGAASTTSTSHPNIGTSYQFANDKTILTIAVTLFTFIVVIAFDLL